VSGWSFGVDGQRVVPVDPATVAGIGDAAGKFGGTDAHPVPEPLGFGGADLRGGHLGKLLGRHHLPVE
jgi:hypothetical protein